MHKSGKKDYYYIRMQVNKILKFCPAKQTKEIYLYNNKCIKMKNLCIKLVQRTIIILGCTVNKILKNKNPHASHCLLMRLFSNLYYQ